MTTGEESAPPGAAAGPTASSGPARPAPAPPGHTPEEAAGPTSPAPGQQRPPLRRGLNTPLAGVCLGLSRHLGLSVPVVRATMIALGVVGIGLVLYCWLWVFVPSEDEVTADAGTRGLSGHAVDSSSAQQTASPGSNDDGEQVTPGERVKRALDSLTSSPEVLLGGLLLGVAAVITLQLLGTDVDWWLFGPPALLAIGVLLAWSQVDTPRRGTRNRHTAIWQFAAGACLVVISMLVIAGGFVPASELMMGLVLAGMLLAGVALVAAPWVIKLYRTMATERARAAAEAERADIAAHLHDSVLQTLAMIQKQRFDPASVEHLARSQERQLRGWLYRQGRWEASGTGEETLEDELLAIAEELEALHKTPVEVVAVGGSRGQGHHVLVAAAREAIVNALKHAGPASVYVESDETADTVFIRDRGPGFDLDSMDQDRLGVRESIIGRMQRAGGEATIRSTERGTEVRLRMPGGGAGAESRERPADRRPEGAR